MGRNRKIYCQELKIIPFIPLASQHDILGIGLCGCWYVIPVYGSCFSIPFRMFYRVTQYKNSTLTRGREGHPVAAPLLGEFFRGRIGEGEFVCITLDGVGGSILREILIFGCGGGDSD